MNKHREALSGVFAPLTTPFTESGKVDFKGLERNMAKYAVSKLKGYLVLGSNGENKSLSLEEKLKVVETVIGSKGAGQRVMTGCIAESTQETIEIAKKAQEIGTDYITLLPPCYFKAQMTDEVLEAYFSEAANAVGKPCLLYNAPAFTGGTVLSVELVKRLSGHGNIVGIKDSCNLESINGYLLSCPESFSAMTGIGSCLAFAMINGATGGIVSLGNIFPDECGELWKLIQERRYEEGFDLNRKILRISRIVTGMDIPVVKAAMDLKGWVGGYPRKPLLPLNQEAKTRLEAALLAEGML